LLWIVSDPPTNTFSWNVTLQKPVYVLYDVVGPYTITGPPTVRALHNVVFPSTIKLFDRNACCLTNKLLRSDVVCVTVNEFENVDGAFTDISPETVTLEVNIICPVTYVWLLKVTGPTNDVFDGVMIIAAIPFDNVMFSSSDNVLLAFERVILVALYNKALDGFIENMELDPYMTNDVEFEADNSTLLCATTNRMFDPVYDQDLTLEPI
jgi:hypothetical protein